MLRDLVVKRFGGVPHSLNEMVVHPSSSKIRDGLRVS